jgi:hypothetical protein
MGNQPTKTSKSLNPPPHKRSDWGRQSNHFHLIEQNGKQMWASVTFMQTRQSNARTENQKIQRRQCSEFARNGTRDSIISCSNRMASKCEQVWHSCQQDNPMHVPRISTSNDASAPISLGIEPVSWLYSVQIEWQRSVSKHDIHTNKRNQFTYRDTALPTTWVGRVRLELNPWADYKLFK